ASPPGAPGRARSRRGRSAAPPAPAPARAWPRSGFAHQLEMLDHGRRGEVRADDGAPLGEQRAAAEVQGVVLQRLPEDLQDVALGVLDAAVDRGALEAARAADDGGEAL